MFENHLIRPKSTSRPGKKIRPSRKTPKPSWSCVWRNIISFGQNLQFSVFEHFFIKTFSFDHWAWVCKFNICVSFWMFWKLISRNSHSFNIPTFFEKVPQFFCACGIVHIAYKNWSGIPFIVFWGLIFDLSCFVLRFHL